LGHQTFGGALCTNAEEGVYGEVKLFGGVFCKGHACGFGAMPGLAGICGGFDFVAKPRDDGLFAPSLQMNGSF
jgi:hypothetical protein